MEEDGIDYEIIWEHREDDVQCVLSNLRGLHSLSISGFQGLDAEEHFDFDLEIEYWLFNNVTIVILVSNILTAILAPIIITKIRGVFCFYKEPFEKYKEEKQAETDKTAGKKRCCSCIIDTECYQ